MAGGAGTRERILQIAQELFVDHGYAATSIADIAEGLGTSKAALYHHFKSKEQILEELLATAEAALTRLADFALTHPDAPELLGAVIDVTVSAGPLLRLIDGDPSVMHQVADRLGLWRRMDEIVMALAIDDPGRGAQIRARAGFTVAKELTLFAFRSGWDLSPAVRAEILQAALRALGDLARDRLCGGILASASPKDAILRC